MSYIHKGTTFNIFITVSNFSCYLSLSLTNKQYHRQEYKINREKATKITNANTQF